MKAKKSKKEVVKVRMTTRMKRDLAQIAAAHEQSMSEVIRQLALQRIAK